jgi:hypothetical protein
LHESAKNQAQDLSSVDQCKMPKVMLCGKENTLTGSSINQKQTRGAISIQTGKNNHISQATFPSPVVKKISYNEKSNKV